MSAPKTWCDWQLGLMQSALDACPEADRARYLSFWSARWQGRYDRFCETEGDSERTEPTYGKPHASDFVIIIGRIQGKLAELREPA